MAHTGLVYYYDQAGLSTDDLVFYFDFNSSGSFNSSIVDNSFNLSGNTGNFWLNSGSGLFSGTIMGVNNELGSTSYLSLITLFKKESYNKSILISTLKSGLDGISGFLLGINDANKLYLTAYDSESSQFITNTSKISLSNENGISLVKGDNVFTIGKFNFSEKTLKTERHIFPYSCNTSFDKIFIGGGSGLPDSISNDFFTGYIDEILLVKESLNSNSINYLFKSFYKNEPTTSYTLVEEHDSYQYSNLTNVSTPIWEEMQSGALDYIRTNIFNTTGIGTIRIINSGNIINGTGYVSGNLSGIVSLQSGYYQVTTGSGVTGYTTSGKIATATGITGYVNIDLYPITVFTSGNIYQLSAQSGISGITQWTDVFSGPLYETILTTGFVSMTLSSPYSLNFSYVITGMSGNATYLHIADYSNNGNDNILISHDLNYTGHNASFRAFKRTQLKYKDVYIESQDDLNFINKFKMNGVVLVNPIKSGDIIDLVSQNYSGLNDYNNDYDHSLASGLFSYTGDLNSDDIYFFINGIYQHPNKTFEDVWFSTGVDILSSDGSPWIIKSLFSGDYDLVNGYFDTDNLYDRNDLNIVDNIPFLNIIKLKRYITGLNDLISGYNLITGSSINNDSLFFINGLKLISGIDYSYNNSVSGYELINNNMSGITGILFGVSPTGIGNISGYVNYNGLNNSLIGNFSENSSLLFYNRLRQNLNIDYIETSSLDLIHGLSGFYEVNTEEILNK